MGKLSSIIFRLGVIFFYGLGKEILELVFKGRSWVFCLVSAQGGEGESLGIRSLAVSGDLGCGES